MYLMASNKQIQTVELQKGSGDIWTKCDAHAPLVRAATLTRLRVAPQQLAHEPIIRRLPANRTRISLRSSTSWLQTPTTGKCMGTMGRPTLQIACRPTGPRFLQVCIHVGRGLIDLLDMLDSRYILLKPENNLIVNTGSGLPSDVD